MTNAQIVTNHPHPHPRVVSTTSKTLTDEHLTTIRLHTGHFTELPSCLSHLKRKKKLIALTNPNLNEAVSQ